MFVSAARRVARRPIHLITSVDQCRSLVERVLSSGQPCIGVDCEGTQIGRFGNLSLLQLATDEEVFLVDVAVGGAGIVEPLSPLFGSRDVVKVFHDCREDASLLLERHGTPLVAVFDTQVGHQLWLERSGLEAYQASAAEVLRTFQLGLYRAHRWSELEKKPIRPQLWGSRPLDPAAVRYAVEGVAHLLPLRRAICRELGDPDGDLVLRRSMRYTDYAHLNLAELPTEDISWLRPGAPIKGMLATRRADAAYFKVNCSPLTGAVLDRVDLQDFADLQAGDVASCIIKSVSECRQFAHLRREGHGELVFDRRHREMRRLPGAAALDEAKPSRESSLYGFGAGDPSGRPAVEADPGSFREPQPEIFYKPGKRGVPKTRDTGIKPPRRRGPAARGPNAGP